MQQHMAYKNMFNDLCPLSVFNLHKEVVPGRPLLKLLSNTLVSFTSFFDLDFYHLVICRQLLVGLN